MAHGSLGRREAILLFKHLLSGAPEAFNGEVFRLTAGARLQFQPFRSEVPIVVGTWGSQTARVAGELADEVKIGASANPAMVGHLRPAIDAGSERADRPAGSVGICVGTPTVVDIDRAAARALARRIVSIYLPVVAGLDPTMNDPEWLARIQALAGRGDYEQVARDTSDEMLERFVIAGDSDDVVRQVESLAHAGASRVEFGNPHGIDEAEGVRLLGQRVLRHFR